MATARAVKDSRHLVLSGVEAFEGILHGKDDADTEAKVRKLYQDVVGAAAACEEAGLFGTGPVILSGGGSAYYDLAAEGLSRTPLKSETLLVIRSGCYLTHDSAWLDTYWRRMRERSPELSLPRRDPQAALEVWATIQSIPEEGLAFATMGKRDVSYDMDLPVPLAWFRPGMAAPQPLEGHKVTGLNDQHAYLQRPEGSPLQVGDLVSFGISHPCTTFDKWRLIPVVDDGYGVVGAVTTEF
jgi:D-serine dehydratase